MTSILIELGWPAKALNPNNSVHYMKLARFKQASMATAYWTTKEVIGPSKYPHSGERIPFVITAYPPDKRSRDDDNLIASMKSARDGIAKALGVDDKYFDQRLQWGEPCKPGKVVVAIGCGA
jgi:crossover junction endodeoxyribonuclease RusA